MLKDLKNTPYFLFTQQSLATFDNCPLKFRKKYMENLKWDRFPDELVKKRLEMGNQFHLLAHRYFLGIDPGLEAGVDGSKELEIWLNNLRKRFPLTEDTRYLPEYKMRMISPVIKLEANFDLLLIRGRRLEIWDWKTHGEQAEAKRKSLERRLLDSLQTKVYLFMLKEQAGLLLGEDPGDVEISMHYWQPYPPMTLLEIRYNDPLHTNYREILEDKIQTIYDYNYENFNKAQYSSHCKYCEFNWFCNNQQVDFNAVAEEEDLLESLDWDSIEEKW